MTKILFLIILSLKYLEILPFSSKSPKLSWRRRKKIINLSPSSHSTSKSLCLLRVAGMGSISGTGNCWRLPSNPQGSLPTLPSPKTWNLYIAFIGFWTSELQIFKWLIFTKKCPSQTVIHSMYQCTCPMCENISFCAGAEVPGHKCASYRIATRRQNWEWQVL